MNNLLNNLKKYYTKKNVDRVFLALPVLAMMFVTGKYLLNTETLNRLEALPAFYLVSNNTAAGQAAGTLFTALSGSGFSIGADTQVNTNSDSYIAWNWAEGTIPGLDVLTYTGTGVAHTIAHTLGDTPDFIMVKRTDAGGDNWFIYHQSQGATVKCSFDAAACGASVTAWNNTAPTSANFTVGTSADTNTNGSTHIAYIFAEKSGFSKFSGYTGNGSADGPNVFTGFKPKFIMIRNTAGGNWVIWDSQRDTTNPASTQLFANSSAAESSSTSLDINANGFKIRNTGADYNSSGATYIYAAFAESPLERATTNQGFTVSTSSIFRSNAWLSRTPGVSGSNTTWTFSAWVKRAGGINDNTPNGLFRAGTNNAGNRTVLSLYNNDELEFMDGANGGCNPCGTYYYRDNSAWMHYVAVADLSNGTASDRTRIYINGVRQSLSGNISGTTKMNTAGIPMIVGARSILGAEYWDGYMADVNFVDGQALSPTSFGQSDANGNWGPINYAGAYGTNGFHLNFADPNDPGNDVSGNNNDFTNNNIQVTDNVVDSPTKNFPIFNSQTANTYGETISSGALSYTDTSGFEHNIDTTLAVDSGKWYAEFTSGTVAVGMPVFGVIVDNLRTGNVTLGAATGEAGWRSTFGSYAVNGVITGAGTFTTGDVIGVAFDAATGKVWFSKNGVFSGNPVAGTGEAGTLTGKQFRFAMSSYPPNGASTFNAGQASQKSSSVTYSTPGVYSYTVPSYSTITVTLAGGGGGGGGSKANCASTDGSTGGTSSFATGTNPTANGGTGGQSDCNGAGAGTDGTASGGDTNTTGGGGSGGSAAPDEGNGSSGAGGAGGLAVKTFTSGQLAVGGTVTVTVGSGGTGGNGDSSGGDGGSGYVTISSSGAGTYDAASGGYFQYTPPTGFKALNSANMLTAGVSAIADPTDYFDVFTYTGNGTAQTFTNLSFQPGLVWIKSRTSALNNILWGDGSNVAPVVTSIMQWFEF